MSRENRTGTKTAGKAVATGMRSDVDSLTSKTPEQHCGQTSVDFSPPEDRPLPESAPFAVGGQSWLRSEREDFLSRSRQAAETVPCTGLTFQQVLAALRTNWRTGLTVALAVICVTVSILVFSPRLYLSEARLFVRIGRESVSLDPTATTGERVTVYESRESEINSVIDMLKSEALLAAVLDEVGLEAILDKAPQTPRDRRAALKRLEKAIYTDHNSKSSVITIACEAQSPELAQQILTTYLAAFRDAYVAANRTSGSLEFFEAETDHARGQLVTAQRKLAAARKPLQLSSFDGRLAELQGRKGSLEEALASNRTELALAHTRIAAIERRRGELPQRMLANHTETNSAFDQTRGELYRLKVRQQELLVKYTSHHPLVREVTKQIESAEAILTEHPRSTRDDAASPIRQDLELGLLHDEAHVESLEAQRQELQSQLAATGTELQRLLDAHAEIEDLEREVERHRKSLIAATERLEEARIDRALAHRKISNVNPIQQPTLDLEPVAPRKKLVAGLGLVGAIFAGVAASLIRELLGERAASTVPLEVPDERNEPHPESTEDL